MYKITPQASLLPLLILLAFVSCTKGDGPKSTSVNTSNENLAQSPYIQNNIQTSASTNPSAITNWQLQVFSFYNFSEGKITKNIADANLQDLGDLVDQNNFATASVKYRVPVDSLKKLKTLFYNAFNYWYYNIYKPGLTVSSSTGTPNLSGPVVNLYLDPCSDIYIACKDNANLDYFERHAECYTAAIGVAAFTTPLGGGIFAVGCGLWAGRHRTNDLTICTGNYNLCH